MTYLVDANVLSEATKPSPNPGVLEWLKQNEREIAVDPFILGEIRFGILLLPPGKRRQRLERWFREGAAKFFVYRGTPPQDCAGPNCLPTFGPRANPCPSRTV